jgi:hypothetical protein
LISVPFISSSVRMMMKMMNFQNFRTYKAFVHFGTSCILHYCFLFTSRQFFPPILSCWVPALVRAHPI